MERVNTIICTILLGSLAVIMIFTDLLFRLWGIGVLFIYPLLIIGLIITLIFSFRLKYKKLMGLNGFFLALVLAAPFLPEINLLEQKSIFEAHLIQERSSWNLKLYKNEKFRVRETNLGGFEDFEGKYSIIEDKIIFHSKPCGTSLIPDTVKIWENHLIINEFSSKPDTSLYNFKIIKNELKTCPNTL